MLFLLSELFELVVHSLPCNCSHLEFACAMYGYKLSDDDDAGLLRYRLAAEAPMPPELDLTLFAASKPVSIRATTLPEATRDLPRSFLHVKVLPHLYIVSHNET
jgi:hypothetical protein